MKESTKDFLVLGLGLGLVLGLVLVLDDSKDEAEQ